MRLKHEHQSAQKRHHGNKQVLGAVMRDLADLFEIFGDATHEVAGLLIVKEENDSS